jgi:hypothetical protein
MYARGEGLTFILRVGIDGAPCATVVGGIDLDAVVGRRSVCNDMGRPA